MNTIQKIMNILMNPNAELTNVIVSLFFFFEVYLYINMFITLLNIKPNKKVQYSCIVLIFIISIIAKFIIPMPYNTIFNLLLFILMSLIFFKTKVLDTCIVLAIFFSLTTLFEMISSQIYTLIFNKPYAEALSMPIYHIIF